MLYGGHFIADTTPDKLDDIKDDVVSRFVQGRASKEELAAIESNGVTSFNVK